MERSGETVKAKSGVRLWGGEVVKLGGWVVEDSFLEPVAE
jgi:hypothetical protein